MKYRVIILIAGLFFLAIARAHAQDVLPCGGDDPDATCPIDSWVILLAAVSTIFAVYTLLKRKKAVNSSTIH